MHPIDEDLRSCCEAVRAFAETHPWRHMDPSWNPGTHPGHQLDISSGYHVVFSITLVPGLPPMRHLSISAPSQGRLPNPRMACFLAPLFGFFGGEEGSTEPAEGWAISIDPVEMCITINQPMRAEDRGVMPS